MEASIPLVWSPDRSCDASVCLPFEGTSWQRMWMPSWRGCPRIWRRSSNTSTHPADQQTPVTRWGERLVLNSYYLLLLLDYNYSFPENCDCLSSWFGSFGYYGDIIAFVLASADLQNSQCPHGLSSMDWSEFRSVFNPWFNLDHPEQTQVWVSV